MKKLLGILVLGLFLITPSQANDISDFEIEGMSIGDSALNFFSKQDIKENSWDYYKDKEYTPVQMPNFPFFNTYDYVDFDFKTNDPAYTIHALYGVTNYNKIKNCYEKMDEIVLEMSDTFKNVAKKGKKDIERDPRYTGDPTGKTIVTRVSFWFYNESRASVSCYDYFKEEGDDGDNLTVGLQTKEQNDFLLNRAYK